MKNGEDCVHASRWKMYDVTTSFNQNHLVDEPVTIGVRVGGQGNSPPLRAVFFLNMTKNTNRNRYVVEKISVGIRTVWYIVFEQLLLNIFLNEFRKK